MKAIQSSIEEYWQQHIDACNASRVKKSVYCREHQIKYDQMMYWQKRLRQEKAPSFVPIKIKRDSVTFHERPMCTLILSGGHVLKINDEKALILLLDKWK